MRKDIVRDTPSLEEFCDYIERKGYDIDPFALYKEFEARAWTTAKCVRTKSWPSLVDARNSFVSQSRMNDHAVLLGIPKPRKHESKHKYQRMVDNSRTKAVKMNYDEFLQDPLWFAFRQFVFAVRVHKCEVFGSTDRLQVHHVGYRKCLLPWEYTCNDVKVLCRNCHARVHG